MSHLEVDVWMKDFCSEANIGWNKRVLLRYVDDQFKHSTVIWSVHWALKETRNQCQHLVTLLSYPTLSWPCTVKGSALVQNYTCFYHFNND